MFFLLLFMCWIYVINCSPSVTRIYGGHPIKITKAPYQVSIYNKIYKDHVCGGSIVSSYFVLTAGHCFDSEDEPSDLIIRASSTYWNKGGSLHQVDKIVVHKDHKLTDYWTTEYDIALLKVSIAFDVKNSLNKIVCLFNLHEKVPPGTMALLSGWGATKTQRRAKHLQGLNVKILNQFDCQRYYSDLNGLNEGQICATSPNGLRDFCWGDSGSPLVVNGRQVGLVSYSGPGCAEVGRPGVYTEIAFFRDWIDKHIQNDTT